MEHIDESRATIEVLQIAMGKALDKAIHKHGGKVAFAKKAGLSRATLYRLLSGENVSTDVLLRTLRTLGRLDLLHELTTPPQPSPLELRPPVKKPRRTAPPAQKRPAASGSLVSQLALGRLPEREVAEVDTREGVRSSKKGKR